MKIMQSSDYRIYFDDVRMDPYIKNWGAACGLRASDAVANITMYRTEKLETWKGYLTQVRIFVRNIFSGKFSIVFEGELMNRNWGDSRNDTGEITFMCKGFYHWLDTPIPLMIGMEDAFDHIHRFRYEAQNINVDAVEDLFALKDEIIMKDKSIREIIDALFKAMMSGYYLSDDSSFAWAKLQERFKVMGEVVKEFRMAGYLDTFTFVRATQIDSFYVYLTQVLTQLMFEFYQDRDGALRIKNPSWKDSILKAHVLDESIVQNASGFNDWENEPSRVLVIGGKQDIARTGAPIMGLGNIQTVPMGLYIGQPGSGQYFSENIDVMIENFGVSNNDGFTGGGGAFFDDITGNYTVTSKMGPRWGKQHRGTDYGMKYVPLRSLGVEGEVTKAGPNASMGNHVYVKQIIDGQRYDFVYMHLSEIHVKVGDVVAGGAQLGVTGNTGDSTGPHLHLEVWKGERLAKGSTYLDPEVFLDEMKKKQALGGTVSPGAPGSDVVAQLMNQDLKNQSNWNATQLNAWINSKAKKNSLMYNLGYAIYQASQQSGLDPLYIASHAAHETGWGTSDIVRDKFNFFGIAAFDNSPYKSAMVFANASAGIIEGAKWIRKNYYDRGQNTLWKMRHSNNGKHNYATDKDWPSIIARIWKGANAPVGSSGASSSGSASTGTGGSMTTLNRYLGTPYAGTGGFTFTTKPRAGSFYSAAKEFTEAATGVEKSSEKATPVDYNSFSASKLVSLIPWRASGYQDFIGKRPNGVNINMICCIIEAFSSWNEKIVRQKNHGLMGVHEDYINGVLGGNKSLMYTPEQNIQHATLMFKNGYDRFSNKPTFALASLFAGSMAPVESWIESAGAEDFSKVRNVIPEEYGFVTILVDAVVEKYAALFKGDYIKGDPHRTFVTQTSTGPKVETGLADDATVKDYESSYKPVMSDEERLYKVNLKVSEQLLIRYDTPGTGASDGGQAIPMDADELIERYAKYMMQLYRAESHGTNVTLSTCMPSLRPGFNAWLEPTRRDLVFYITRVNHQGSFNNGAFTTVTGAFVRDPKTYDNIEDNIFVSTTNASAKDFGEVVNKGEMDSLRTELAGMHSTDEVVADARSLPVLSKMYSSVGGVQTEYTTMWANELTGDEVASAITNLYASAPQVVIDRKNNLAAIVAESASFFTAMLLKTDF